MCIQGAKAAVDELRIGVNDRAQVIVKIRAAIAKAEVAVIVAVGDVVIDINAAAVSVIGADAVMAVLVDDIVLDIDSAEGLPEDDSIGAVVGKDVVVDFKVGDGGVAGDLKAIAGVAANDVIDNDLVFAAEVQTVVESAASAAVIVNVIGAVDV